MLIVSCTKCDGWIVVVADESDESTGFPAAAREEAKKPNRKITVTKNTYDERAWGLSGSCRSVTPYAGSKPDCATIP